MFHISGPRNKKDEQGLASIVVVGILIVLLTLISLGFARIMDRTVRNSVNDETATAANYAAQSGINDLATFVRSNPNAVARQCKDLIGTAASKGPFYSSSNLSGEPESGPSAVPAGSRNAEYTCILLNQRPESLYYQQIPAQETKIIKMTTDTTPGSLDRILLSWQSTDTNKRGVPQDDSPSDRLPDVSSWNSSSSGLCRDFSNDPSGCIPMLRLTIYPVPTTGSVANIQADSKTVFLYPHQRGDSGTVESINYGSMTDGAIYHVGCSDNANAPGFNGLANMDCDVVINGIVDIANLDYLYLRLMPIYNHVDIEIKARDIDDRNVEFRGVQAVLDVTAKVGPASKRLQARVDIGGNSQTGGPIEPSPNPISTEDNFPEYTLRSANAICKRTLFNDNYYDYVLIESTSPSCAWSNALIDIPGPQLGCDSGDPACGYYRINGINYYEENPPGYRGTSYIGMGGTANLTWRSVDATSCISSWAGERAPSMSWDQATRTGTGSDTVGGITTVTNFDLRCSGPGGTTPTRTVRAWPPPTTSFAGSDSSYYASQNYTIRFSSTNANRCEMRSTGNQPWNQDYSGITAGGGSSPSDERTFSTNFHDDSPKSYSITCWDPINRSSGTRTITVCRSGCDITIVAPAPYCEADWNLTDLGNGTGRLTWYGACPTWAPGSGYYQFHSCNAELSAHTAGCSWVGNGRDTIVGTGTYCGSFRSGADPWGFLKDTGVRCFTVVVPPVEVVWVSVGDLSWWTWAPCAPDGAGHTWFICDMGIQVRQNGTDWWQLHCDEFADGTRIRSGNDFLWLRGVGWYGDIVPRPSHTISYFCWSDRGGAPYSFSITRN